MRALDPKTLRRIAELIVDAEGPFERKGWQLEELLRDARWEDPPLYDGSSRVQWVLDELSARPPEDVERLIRRLCMPVEYEDGIPGAEAVRTALNEILALEGLTVTEVAGQPVLAEMRSDDGTPVYSAPDGLGERLPRLIKDDAMIRALIDRVNEASVSEQNGAYALAVIGIGSFLEGLLYAVLHDHDEQFRTRGLPKGAGKWDRPERVPLKRLIEEVHDRRWIHLDAMQFADHVRDYRNFVHLRHQMDKDLHPDGDTVMLCWAPVQAVLNDLDNVLTSPDGTAATY